MSSEILTADEAAQFLKVDRQRIYQLVREKHVPAILLGQRQYRFSKAALERWVEEGGSRRQGGRNETK